MLEDVLKLLTDKVVSINTLLCFCTDNKCSDLYIKMGKKPYISRYGRLYIIPCHAITNIIWNEWSKEAISSENNAKYVRQKMLDFAYDYSFDRDGYVNQYRYRVSAGFSVGKNIATFRMISKELPSFSTINFPKDIAEILRQTALKQQGITIFSGSTGSGKTTTFASCINDFSKPGMPFDNKTIVSLEDPIEYVYNSNNSFNIVQKELGSDFKEYHLGVKQALREHPNFINVAETRDRETINTIVDASQTGHAVWTSWHSSNVGDSISRMYNYLSGDASGQSVMYDLIANINIVMCQRLTSDPVNGFKLSIQYVVFIDQIKKYLNDAVSNGKHLPTVVNSFFSNEELLKLKIVKDWD